MKEPKMVSLRSVIYLLFTPSKRIAEEIAKEFKKQLRFKEEKKKKY